MVFLVAVIVFVLQFALATTAEKVQRSESFAKLVSRYEEYIFKSACLHVSSQLRKMFLSTLIPSAPGNIYMMAVYPTSVLYYVYHFYQLDHDWFTLDMAHTMQDLVRQRVVPPSIHVVERRRRSSAQLLVSEQSPIIPPSTGRPHQVCMWPQS